MNIWIIFSIFAAGISLVLLGSLLGIKETYEMFLTMIAGIVTANSALLAIIVDQLKKR